jgi:hypothetical protein
MVERRADNGESGADAVVDGDGLFELRVGAGKGREGGRKVSF